MYKPISYWYLYNDIKEYRYETDTYKSDTDNMYKLISYWYPYMDTKEYRFDTDIYKSDTDNMYKPIREYKQWTCVQLSTNSWAYAEQTACTVLFSSAQTHVFV